MSNEPTPREKPQAPNRQKTKKLELPEIFIFQGMDAERANEILKGILATPLDQIACVGLEEGEDIRKL
jgi:hypothetical protein